MKFKSNGTKAKRPLKQIQKWEMDFVENQMGIEKKNDNMIRLVPARIESGQSWSLFRDSWSGGFLGILGLEGEKAFFDAPAPSVRGS